jgi:hypothetical protein
MSLKIPCLSVFQPWAELLVAGIKPVENRTRRSNYKGPLLIHASKKFDALWTEGLPPELAIIAKEHLRSVCTFPTKLPRGCIIGLVIQTGCANPGEKVNTWHGDWAFGLLMQDAVKFERPIPHMGRQGMFRADVQGKISPADIMKMICAINKWKNPNK